MKKIKDLFPAQTISGSCKIDMRFILRNKHIVRNTNTVGVMEWTGGQAVYFECNMIEDEKYLRLMYSVGNENFDYKIFIDELPSNLGKGTILYYIFFAPKAGTVPGC